MSFGFRSIPEPPSTNWFDLPAEMRQMVIDRMGPKTRCKFAKCSKICEKEAKISKNYMKNISISREDNPELLIAHGSYDFYNYCLEFIDVEDLTEAQSLVIYKTEPKCYFTDESKMSPRILKWTKTEYGNAEDVRIRYLDEILKKYKRSITHLEIVDEKFPFEKYNIKHVKNLESIFAPMDTDVLLNEFLDSSQILRCDYVELEKTELSFDQILNFEGKQLIIKCDELSEEKILKYLKLWKNGELSRNVKNINILHTGSKQFDVQKMIRAIDGYNYGEDDTECFFKFRMNYEKNEKIHSLASLSENCFCVYIEEKEDQKIDDNFEWDYDSDA